MQVVVGPMEEEGREMARGLLLTRSLKSSPHSTAPEIHPIHPSSLWLPSQSLTYSRRLTPTRSLISDGGNFSGGALMSYRLPLPSTCSHPSTLLPIFLLWFTLWFPQPRWQPRILAAGWGTDDCLILLVVTFLLNPPASLAWGLPLHRPKKWLSHRPASEHLPFIHSVHQQTHMYLWGSQWLTSVILCSSEGDKLIHKPWGCSVVPAPRDTTMLCKLREEAPTPASSTLRGLPGEREAWCDESEKMNRN